MRQTGGTCWLAGPPDRARWRLTTWLCGGDCGLSFKRPRGFLQSGNRHRRVGLGWTAGCETKRRRGYLQKVGRRTVDLLCLARPIGGRQRGRGNRTWDLGSRAEAATTAVGWRGCQGGWTGLDRVCARGSETTSTFTPCTEGARRRDPLIQETNKKGEVSGR